MGFLVHFSIVVNLIFRMDKLPGVSEVRGAVENRHWGVYHWYISQSRDVHIGGPALLTLAPYTLSCLQSIMATVDVPRTFGALLIGGLFASMLASSPFSWWTIIQSMTRFLTPSHSMAGTVAVQVIVYFKLYPKDSYRLKLLVGAKIRCHYTLPCW